MADRSALNAHMSGKRKTSDAYQSMSKMGVGTVITALGQAD
jgi:hypothetical protein